ncbi:hypothetical protein AMTR_s00056p00178660 [Amborella trichopoda]|uniref:Uncharacterized protein n=1 Tax=Amborella trichopoda TaxID=13333 RepID=U5D4C8_AMBTC|nr:hypothetical protein AMTR_s00056p00178660 [Amborella trichopoda]
MASINNPEPHVDMAASSAAPVEVAAAAEKPPLKPREKEEGKGPKGEEAQDYCCKEAQGP